MFKGFGVYKHFKNKYYIGICTIKDADNYKEESVLYMSLYKGDFPKYTLWKRCVKRFNNTRYEVIYAGKQNRNHNDDHEVFRIERYMKLTFWETILFLMGMTHSIRSNITPMGWMSQDEIGELVDGDNNDVYIWKDTSNIGRSMND